MLSKISYFLFLKTKNKQTIFFIASFFALENKNLFLRTIIKLTSYVFENIIKQALIY